MLHICLRERHCRNEVRLSVFILIFESDPVWIALVHTLPTNLYLLLVCSRLNQSHSSSSILDEEALTFDRELHPGHAARVASRYDAQGSLNAVSLHRYHKARGFEVNLD